MAKTFATCGCSCLQTSRRAHAAVSLAQRVGEDGAVRHAVKGPLARHERHDGGQNASDQVRDDQRWRGAHWASSSPPSGAGAGMRETRASPSPAADRRLWEAATSMASYRCCEKSWSRQACRGSPCSITGALPPIHLLGSLRELLCFCQVCMSRCIEAEVSNLVLPSFRSEPQRATR